MNKLGKPVLLIAVCLSALAGCVDAIGFLQLRGYFVSFMSGNSTQLAVGLVAGNWLRCAQLAGIVALFIVGTMLGTWTAHFARRGAQAASVLALVTGLLLVACLGAAFGKPLVAISLMTLAMGAENATLQRDGEVAIGVTYMTGTLVKMGQRLANAMLGKEAIWSPYLWLWLGLIAGGLAGAALFAMFGLAGLWFATAYAAALTVFVRFIKIDLSV